MGYVVVPVVAAFLGVGLASPVVRPANGGSGNVAVSASGRYVALASAASNLVRGDTNRLYDVSFTTGRNTSLNEQVSGPVDHRQMVEPASPGSAPTVALCSCGQTRRTSSMATRMVSPTFRRDRLAKTTSRVSVGTDGKQLDTESGQATISGNGRFVAFASDGTVFVHDRVIGMTQSIGRGASPTLNANGRYVAFNGPPGGVVVLDRASGATDQVSISTEGSPLPGVAVVPTISGDGRFVAFVMQQALPIPPITPNALYVRDRLDRTTKLIERSVGYPAISGDGRTIVYQGGSTSRFQEVLVKDLASGGDEVESVPKRGVRANGPSFTGVGSLSFNGRFVAFLSDASNLVARDANHATDVFVRDRRSRQTELISVGRPLRRVRG